MKLMCETALVLLLLPGSLLGCATQDSTSPDDSESLDEITAAASTSRLPSLGCGTWNSSGVHTTGEYFVGHSKERGSETAAYFVFDLSSLKGRTVAAASLTIPGTNDWTVTVPWTNHSPLFQFKLGPTPLPSGLTLAQVTTGSNDASVFHAAQREQDLGYGWFPSGSTTNTYDSFHYNPSRFQDAVNAGGRTVMFAVNRFGTDASTEEYLYGGSRCTSAVVLNVTVN